MKYLAGTAVVVFPADKIFVASIIEVHIYIYISYRYQIFLNVDGQKFECSG